MKPLRYREVKRYGRNRCCICGRRLSRDSFQVGLDMRACIKCIARYSFSVMDEAHKRTGRNNSRGRLSKNS